MVAKKTKAKKLTKVPPIKKEKAKESRPEKAPTKRSVLPDDVDLSSLNKATPSDAALKSVRDLAQKMIDYDLAIKETTEQMRMLKEAYDNIATNTLPALMDSIGIPSFKVAGGFEIEVADFLSASVPSENAINEAIRKKKPNAEQLAHRREEALTFLRENNAEDLIKNYVFCEFGRGQFQRAETLLKELRDAGYDPGQEESVNSRTLTAWVKDRLKEGKPIPFTTFSVQSGRIAKIK